MENQLKFDDLVELSFVKKLYDLPFYYYGRNNDYLCYPVIYVNITEHGARCCNFELRSMHYPELFFGIIWRPTWEELWNNVLPEVLDLDIVDFK